MEKIKELTQARQVIENYRKRIIALEGCLEALKFCAKMLDDDGGQLQGIMYSDALGPKDDDMTALEYIKDAISKVEKQ